MSYDGFINSNRWTELRKKIFLVQGRICNICGVDRKLHCHHLFYRDPIELTEEQDCRVLCEDCHSNLHKMERTGNKKLRYNSESLAEAVEKYLYLKTNLLKKKSPPKIYHPSGYLTKQEKRHQRLEKRRRKLEKRRLNKAEALINPSPKILNNKFSEVERKIFKSEGSKEKIPRPSSLVMAEYEKDQRMRKLRHRSLTYNQRQNMVFDFLKRKFPNPLFWTDYFIRNNNNCWSHYTFGQREIDITNSYHSFLKLVNKLENS